MKPKQIMLSPTKEAIEVDDDMIEQFKNEGYTPAFELISPDGEEVIVSGSVVNEAFKRGYMPKESVENLKNVPKQSMLESAAHGLTQGVTLGFADELAGLYDPELKKGMREKFQQASEQNPISTTLGEIGGGLLSSAAVPGAFTAGRAIATGALEGIGKSDTMSSAPKEAVLGGVLGGLGYKAADAISKFDPSKLAGKLRTSAEHFAVRAANPNPSEILKNVKDPEKFGRTMLDEGFVEPFMTKNKLYEKAADITGKTGEEFGKFEKRLPFFPVDKESFLKDLRGIGSKYRDISSFDPLARETSDKIDDIVNPYIESVVTQSKRPNAKKLLEMRRTIGDTGLFDADSGLSKIEKDVYRKLYGVLDDNIDKAIKNRLGEEALREWQQINARYSVGKTIGKISDKRKARDIAGSFKNIGVPSLIAAGGVYAGSPVLGFTLATVDFLRRHYGPSTAAVGLDGLANLIEKAPDKIAKYLPKITMGTKDPFKLLSVHTALMAVDPEYKELVTNGGIQ